MTEREKVVRAVETCFDSWIDKHRNMGLDWHGVERMKRDALELLKEQEPVKPKTHNGGGKSPTWWYVCGACGHDIDPKDKFCRECGKAVKWDAQTD